MPNSDEISRKGTRIILVDDDDLFRESLQQNLTDSGFAVTGFREGAAALDYVAQGGTADLILLDWKMPGMNGIQVLREVRDKGLDIPVIFLTVLSDQMYEEAALLSGAVDFVEKARSFSILLKRVELILSGAKALTGSHEIEGNGNIRRGHLELRQDTGRALWKERQVELSLTEFKMLHYLVSRAGNDVRYRELYDLVHGKDFVAGPGEEGYRTNVRTFIKRIRQKFRAVDDSFAHIENYPGFGYRWRDEVREGAEHAV
ncbi:MAG TPA: response regulator transcription factor [Alphaproteobacteria bacterium]|jgi:two-component system response regulator ChvI|nr:response regulator transcription factor [Alphaproteobacteria bacterium]